MPLYNNGELQKVIGIDISLGNYASTQDQIHKKNKDLINKYFKTKGNQAALGDSVGSTLVGDRSTLDNTQDQSQRA